METSSDVNPIQPAWKRWLMPLSFLLAMLCGTMIWVIWSGKGLHMQFMAPRAQVEVDWKLLANLDYVTGKSGPELEKLNHTMIRVPGFMVPLEDNSKKVTQFLLVPTPQACIHVPPPPPNQMLLVNMNPGTEVQFGPIWVHGVLSILPQKTMYGEVSFGLEAKFIEPYQ